MFRETNHGHDLMTNWLIALNSKELLKIISQNLFPDRI